MANIPAALDPTWNPAFGTIDLFDTKTLPQGGGMAFDSSVESVWNTLADMPSKVIDYTTESFTSVWTGVSDLGADLVNAAENKVSSFLTTTGWIIVVGVGLLLLTIYVLGKSGITKDVATVLAGRV